VEDATVVKSEEMDEDEIEEEEENMKPFCCNICARGFHCKFFEGKPCLRKFHVFMVLGPAWCELSEIKYYSAKEELKTHTCTRTHPKPFECDICRKGFSTKSNMQRHRNIHTKEKVFQCNHCSKVN